MRGQSPERRCRRIDQGFFAFIDDVDPAVIGVERVVAGQTGRDGVGEQVAPAVQRALAGDAQLPVGDRAFNDFASGFGIDEGDAMLLRLLHGRSIKGGAIELCIVRRADGRCRAGIAAVTRKVMRQGVVNEADVLHRHVAAAVFQPEAGCVQIGRHQQPDYHDDDRQFDKRKA
jgi:hypothetical protein